MSRKSNMAITFNLVDLVFGYILAIAVGLMIHRDKMFTPLHLGTNPEILIPLANLLVLMIFPLGFLLFGSILLQISIYTIRKFILRIDEKEEEG